MLKRVLADVSLKENIFIIDSTKQILSFVQQELLQRGRIVDNELVYENEYNDLSTQI